MHNGRLLDRRYSIEFDLTLYEENMTAPATPFKLSDYYTHLAIIGFIVIIIFIIYEIYGAEFFTWTLSALRGIARSNSIIDNFLIICTQIPFAAFFVPSVSSFNIILAYLMKDFWRCLFLTTFGAVLWSSLTFLVIRKYFRETIINKFKGMMLFRIVYIEVKKNPWQMGFIFNFLFIPMSVKNYLISLTSIELRQLAVILTCVHLVYNAIFSFVGTQMTDMSRLFKSTPFSEKTFPEKLQTVFTWVILLVTVGSFVALFLLAKRKYQEMEDEMKMESVIAKSQICELEDRTPN